MRFDAEIWANIQRTFQPETRHTGDKPQSSPGAGRIQILTNLRGTAPGLFYEQGVRAFSPLLESLEMRHVFSTQAKPSWWPNTAAEKPSTKNPAYLRHLESALAELLAGFSPLPEINLAWLPQTGRVDLRFYGRDQEKVTESANNCLKLVGDQVWGLQRRHASKCFANLLRKLKLTISVAESCTGGLLQKC